MADIKEKATAAIASAYYGEGAVIGDGKFIEMFVKFLSTFLTGCPLGAKRAHAMLNGGPFRQRRAKNALEYAAYEWTGGDSEQTTKITDAGVKAGLKFTEQEFVEFAEYGWDTGTAP